MSARTENGADVVLTSALVIATSSPVSPLPLGYLTGGDPP